MGTISVEVDVDLDDILDGLTKKQRAELSRAAAEDGFRDSGHIIREACVMIRRGDAIDAARFLEAEFFPKWQSVGDCAASLKKVESK